MMKRAKYLLFLPLMLLIFFPFSATHSPVAFAETENNLTEDAFEDEVLSQLEDLDFSQLDKILDDFTNNHRSIFGEKTFIEKVLALVRGEFNEGEGVLNGLFRIIFDSFLSLLPTLSIIIAVSLIGNLLNGIKPTSNGKSLTNIINFVVYGVVVILVLSIIVKMITLATNTITNVQNQMNAVFPILLTLLTAIGGMSSVSVYQPAMALLSNGLLNLFSHILLPIFIFSVVFSIVSNLSNTVKLDKFAGFCNSAFKWVLGLAFTIFTAFLSIQGLTAGTIDGISIRTAKFAIRSYIPMLGGYISDGMGLILTSSNLIKNVVGASGLFMMIASILSPLIEMIMFMLALKLISGIIEPLGNKQIANFISSLSKSMVLLIVILIGVAFVYFIMLGLIICTANVI